MGSPAAASLSLMKQEPQQSTNSPSSSFGIKQESYVIKQESEANSTPYMTPRYWVEHVNIQLIYSSQYPFRMEIRKFLLKIFFTSKRTGVLTLWSIFSSNMMLSRSFDMGPQSAHADHPNLNHQMNLVMKKLSDMTSLIQVKIYAGYIILKANT